MTASLKSALVLAATLALGVLLGVLGAGRLAQYRRDQLRGLRRPPAFAEHLERVIGPRDEVQRAALHPLIDATGRRNDRIIRDANDRLRAGMDSLRAALDPLLDADQRARLDRELPGLSGPFQPAGPPPAGPPPAGPPPGPPPGPAPAGYDP